MKTKNNRGFSLIEMVAVIAIMAVALGVIGMSVTYIAKTRSRACAEELNAAIEFTRLNCLSKAGNVELRVYTKDDGIYMSKVWEGTEEKIGSNRISVSYAYSDGAGDAVSKTLGDASDPLVISFEKGSGGIKVPALGSGNLVITVVGNKTFTITCYKLTGKTVIK